MLTQQEMIEKLTEWGEPVTAQTLRNREKQGIVSSSYRGGSGRAGRSVFYPDICLWENYAASKMLNSQRLRLTAKEVVRAKDIADYIMSDPVEALKEFHFREEEELLDLRMAEIWIAFYLYAKYGCPKEWAVLISFYGEEFGELVAPFDRYEIRAATQNDKNRNEIDAFTLKVASKSSTHLKNEVTPICPSDGNIVWLETD